MEFETVRWKLQTSTETEKRNQGGFLYLLILKIYLVSP